MIDTVMSFDFCTDVNINTILLLSDMGFKFIINNGKITDMITEE